MRETWPLIFAGGFIRDALQLISASPWCGIALGNFDGVFAVFRDASLTGSRTIHPESDWFWLWVEVGWPAVLLAIAGIAILVWRVFPLQEGTNQRFRLATLIAAILFVLHGVVDVSGHRVGTAFSAYFSLGMTLRRPAQLRPSLVGANRFSGDRSAAPGGRDRAGLSRPVMKCLCREGWASTTKCIRLQPRVRAEISAKRFSARRAPSNGRRSSGSSTFRARWPRSGRSARPSDALDDFRRARFLEPNAYEVPYQEGIVWLAAEPSLAITAWREALRRVGAQRLEIYGHMLALAAQHSPAVRRGLEEIGMVHHDLALIYLQGAAGADFMTRSASPSRARSRSANAFRGREDQVLLPLGGAGRSQGVGQRGRGASRLDESCLARDGEASREPE